MRTTLSLDDDILAAARYLVGREGKSIGRVVSDLARQGLNCGQQQTVRQGIPLLTRHKPATVVTLELVNRMRDELL